MCKITIVTLVSLMLTLTGGDSSVGGASNGEQRTETGGATEKPAPVPPVTMAMVANASSEHSAANGGATTLSTGGISAPSGSSNDSYVYSSIHRSACYYTVL